MDDPSRANMGVEFLFTYGWAILIVLVAIGFLAYYGILSPDNFIPLNESEKLFKSCEPYLYCCNLSGG